MAVAGLRLKGVQHDRAPVSHAILQRPAVYHQQSYEKLAKPPDNQTICVWLAPYAHPDRRICRTARSNVRRSMVRVGQYQCSVRELRRHAEITYPKRCDMLEAWRHFHKKPNTS